MLTYVLAADGSPLMPTYNIKKVRRMLKDGRAVIAGHKPGFTIQLIYASGSKSFTYAESRTLRRYRLPAHRSLCKERKA